MVQKDQLFDQCRLFGPEGFVFDARVAQVFDDMVSRSVPGYATIQLLTADLALCFAKGNPIYDVGCSTGNTIKAIAERAPDQGLTVIGIDDSQDMLTRCAQKLAQVAKDHELILVKGDLSDESYWSQWTHKAAGVVILNLVLQFIRPLERLSVLKSLRRHMVPGAALLLVEKTTQDNPELNSLFVDYYHSYKKEMGYTDLEIAQKREALENRLIPCHPHENVELLKQAGFEPVTTFFQWMNFQGYLAINPS